MRVVSGHFHFYNACGGQRTTYRSQFHPSVMWVQRSNSSGLGEVRTCMQRVLLPPWHLHFNLILLVEGMDMRLLLGLCILLCFGVSLKSVRSRTFCGWRLDISDHERSVLLVARVWFLLGSAKSLCTKSAADFLGLSLLICVKRHPTPPLPVTHLAGFLLTVKFCSTEPLFGSLFSSSICP